jgi:gas vesicle protein
LRGDWQTNRERFPGLIKDAKDRGDLHASVGLRLIGSAYILDLADDDSDKARQQLAQDLASWSHTQYDLQRACALQGKIDIGLYTQRPDEAWRAIVDEWPLLRRSQLLRVPTMFVFMNCAHARAALALAPQSSTMRRRWLRNVAQRDARRIKRRCAKWSAGLADLLNAGVASLDGDVQGIRRHLLSAEEQLRAADLKGFATAASWHRAAYEPPALADRLRAEALAWAASQGVKRIDRLASCLAPGCYRQGDRAGG